MIPSKTRAEFGVGFVEGFGTIFPSFSCSAILNLLGRSMLLPSKFKIAEQLKLGNIVPKPSTNPTPNSARVLLGIIATVNL